jgi:hypothetical protein
LGDGIYGDGIVRGLLRTDILGNPLLDHRVILWLPGRFVREILHSNKQGLEGRRGIGWTL